MTPVRLGIRENLAQFSLLVVVNAFVGAMVGMERTHPARRSPSRSSTSPRRRRCCRSSSCSASRRRSRTTSPDASPIASGASTCSSRGWLVAAPVPFLLMWAPTGAWVLVANALLGVSQGLTWSTTVIMKIDLAGPQKRGLAMGLNEFAGYFAVAGSALATGLHRCALRPAPRAVLPRRRLRRAGPRCSRCFARARDAAPRGGRSRSCTASCRRARRPTQREVFWRTTLRDRTSRASARPAS